MDTEATRKHRFELALIALSLACAFAIFAFAAAMALTTSRLLATIVALAVAAFAAWLFWRHPVVPPDASPEISPANPPARRWQSRTLYILSGLATAAALFQLARLCVFILNPAAVGCAVSPSRGLGLAPSHSCVSSYFVAAQAASTSPNVYDDQLYSLPSNPTEMRRPRPLGPFAMDVYEYPPPFLLLPRALRVLAPDFLRFRRIWFALNGTVLLIGLLAVARALGPRVGRRALLLAPLVLASDFIIGTLQIGNLQAIVFGLAMLAMLMFAQRRFAAGGALLAFATLSKLFPGLLLVYLVVRRKWTALAWTVGLMVVLVSLSLLDTGRAPYAAFLQHLPKLLGGESFPAFRNPHAVAFNYSVPGMAFKLGLFGVPGASFAAMRIVGWIYTLIVLAATIWIARRPLDRMQQPIAWLTILIIASMRSPFLPGYAVPPALWLLTLLAAVAAPALRTLGFTFLAWLILNISIPITGQDPRLSAIILLLPQTVMLILVLLAIRNRADPRHREALDEHRQDLAEQTV